LLLLDVRHGRHDDLLLGLAAIPSKMTPNSAVEALADAGLRPLSVLLVRIREQKVVAAGLTPVRHLCADDLRAPS
jgi:hypothetical protein